MTELDVQAVLTDAPGITDPNNRVLAVSVSDEAGHPVQHLQANDFSIPELAASWTSFGSSPAIVVVQQAKEPWPGFYVLEVGWDQPLGAELVFGVSVTRKADRGQALACACGGGHRDRDR